MDAAPFIRELADKCERKLGLQIHVYAITNRFFGETITVAGLVTGSDLLAQLQGRELGERLFLPQCMLRDRENVFLDDVTIQELQSKLNVPCESVWNDGYEFVDALAGRKKYKNTY